MTTTNMFENFTILNQSLKTDTTPIINIGDYQYQVVFTGNLFNECTLIVSKKFITAKKFNVIRKITFKEFQVINVTGNELIPDLSQDLHNLYNSIGNSYNQFLPVLILLLADLGIQNLNDLESGIVLNKITKQSIVESFIVVKKQLEKANVTFTNAFKLYCDKILFLYPEYNQQSASKTTTA
jgi:hypothetical protein